MGIRLATNQDLEVIKSLLKDLYVELGEEDELVDLLKDGWIKHYLNYERQVKFYEQNGFSFCGPKLKRLLP